jgi:hypothetical protein
VTELRWLIAGLGHGKTGRTVAELTLPDEERDTLQW